MEDGAAHKDSRTQASQECSTQDTLQREKKLWSPQAEEVVDVSKIVGAFTTQLLVKREQMGRVEGKGIKGGRGATASSSVF